MERKQGLFSAFKEELVRARPRGRRASPSASEIIRRRRPGGETLSPLMEGPDPSGSDCKSEKWGNWIFRPPSGSGSDLRLLLGILGAPLAPVHVTNNDPLPHLTIKHTPIETSSAQYILQQYMAASGGQKLQGIANAYAMGKLKMLASDLETATKVIKNRNSSKTPDSGGFVLWQMNPDMWYIELALGSNEVHAGSNGSLVWRHTPWLGTHAAKGPVRPLRRALQGLDPRTTVNMFANAKCTGEKKINGEDCFVLKLAADPHTLKARSEGPAEIVRHVIFGYFSQKTGLLVHLEDSQLTRIQTNGGDAVYWETTINSFLDDYKPVEGIVIAHSGRSVVTLFRFGETATSHTKTRMEEAWTIEEVAFNVPGLSDECFIPPAELRCSSTAESCEVSQGARTKNACKATVSALDKSHGGKINSVTLDEYLR
nr:uncharacterized protein LOC109153330 [Ipomoea batatas]